MTGLLAAQGMRVSQLRVGESLGRTNPCYLQARRTATARQMYPIPYHADYFGHKLHIDQNEKIVMYGVTHVCAVDRYSGKIVGFISMAIKNNVEIYTHLYRYVPYILKTIVLPSNLASLMIYRELVIHYGLWDQLRVDQGKEWHLMLFIPEQLAHLRTNTNRAPHLQTSSKLASLCCRCR